MKKKIYNGLVGVALLQLTFSVQTHAQNTFPTGVGTSVGVGTNTPASRFQVVGGDSRFGSATNYGQFAADGDLTFTGNGDYLVGGNRYAFRFAGDPDFGLFFNQTNLRYEFRDGAAIPVFYATTSGEGFFAKGVQIGNSILNNAGNIRWTGVDFEGFDGTVWKSLTAAGITSETDPQVGTNTTNFLSKWNGTSLVTSGIFDNATNVGIGTSTPSQKLDVVGNIKSSGTLTATGGNSTNWNSAFGWGNHATAGYLTSELDPKIGVIGSDYIPRWNGSTLVNSAIRSSQSTVGIGIPPNPLYGLLVATSEFSGTIAIDFDLLGTLLGSSKTLFLGGGFFQGSIGYEEATNCISISANTVDARNLNVNLFTGNVGVKNTLPQFPLDVTGDIHSSTGIRIGDGERFSDGGFFTVACNSNIDHETDNLDGLGSSAKRWIDLWAVDGTINTSDAREKSNVKNLEYGIKDVMKLRPVSYTWIKNPERGTKLGLIAQELQEVIPEVVRDWERKADEKTGERKVVPSVRLGVMYDDIIPVLISGIQDQQRTIETKSTELEAVKLEVASLKEMISKMEVASNEVFLNNQISDGINTLNEEKAILEQNAPNPFREKTTINYYIPTNVKNAMVQIYSLNGDAIKTIKVNGTGKGSVEVNGGSFAAGTYTYQLILDGKTIDTKLMVITK